MPKLDLAAIEQTNRTTYPAPMAAEMGKRHFRRLAPAGGLSDFGVSHVVLEPGGVSSQRHWHEGVDEFLIVVAGEAVLVEEDGETLLRTGECAAFPKDVPNAHHLVNRADRECVFVCVGGTAEGDCHYPDVDLHWDHRRGGYSRKDGKPYA